MRFYVFRSGLSIIDKASHEENYRTELFSIISNALNLCLDQSLSEMAKEWARAGKTYDELVQSKIDLESCLLELGKLKKK